MPSSFDNRILLMPLRVVRGKYMAYSHLGTGMCDRPKIVLVRTANCLRHFLLLHW